MEPGTPAVTHYTWYIYSKCRSPRQAEVTICGKFHSGALWVGFHTVIAGNCVWPHNKGSPGLPKLLKSSTPDSWVQNCLNPNCLLNPGTKDPPGRSSAASNCSVAEQDNSSNHQGWIRISMDVQTQVMPAPGYLIIPYCQ